MPEVDAVIGNSHKSLVAEAALRLAAREAPAAPDFVPIGKILHDDAFAHSELAALPFASDAVQTRPNLKVQDGCGNRCSFCIIPTTRGHSRSVSLAACLDNVQRFVDQGGQESARRGGIELVLSGINLGRWGRDLEPAQRFEDLVAAILTETALPRLRLSSIEPMDWSQNLLALYAEFGTGDHPRLARHAHLPLQSGSDTILRRMYRRYRPWHYAERLAAIRELMPEAAIGADVMIGFPGETDALFEESYRFIAEQPFTYLHLFPFSARPSTPAWEFHRQQPVADQVVRRRMQALRNLMTEKFEAFRSGLIGRTLSAVTIEAGPEGATAAVTDNFLKLTLNETLPANRLVAARIAALTADGLCGTVQS